MKISTDSIQGFDGMTAEQKLEAVLSMEIDPTKAGYKTQADFDRVMKEAADNRRKLNEVQGSKDTETQELMQKLTDLENSHKQLMREKQVSDLTARYIGMGYDEGLAGKIATATADNKMEDVLKLQQEFLVEHDKKMKADALKGMQGLQGGRKDEGEGRDEATETARRLGKAAADRIKSSSSVLSNYTLK